MLDDIYFMKQGFDRGRERLPSGGKCPLGCRGL